MRSALTLLCLCVCLSSLPAQCGQAGAAGVPQIQVSSNLLDSDFILQVTHGAPNAHWLMLADTVAGPTVTPFGTFCTGPNPLITANSLAFTAPPLDMTGAVSLPGSLPLSFGPLVNVPLYLQAVVLDPTAPFGVALSDSFSFTIASPRVFVVSDGAVQRNVEIYDALALASGQPALLDTITMQGLSDLTVSRDGRTLFTRDITSNTPNRVRAFDISQVPAVHLADAVVSTTGVGTSNQGVVLSPDQTKGYFVDKPGLLHRFDADPASPTFMTITGTASLSLPSPEGVAVSPDGLLLYVSGGGQGTSAAGTVAVVDDATMTQVSSIPITLQMPFLLGFAFVTDPQVSPDGTKLAVLEQGAFGGAFTGAAGLSIIDIDPSSPTSLTEIQSVALPNYGQNQTTFDRSDPTGQTMLITESTMAGAVQLRRLNWATGVSTVTPLSAGGGMGANDGGCATSGKGNLVFASAAGANTIYVLDANLNLLNSVPSLAGGTPQRIRVEQR